MQAQEDLSPLKARAAGDVRLTSIVRKARVRQLVVVGQEDLSCPAVGEEIVVTDPGLVL